MVYWIFAKVSSTPKRQPTKIASQIFPEHNWLSQRFTKKANPPLSNFKQIYGWVHKCRDVTICRRRWGWQKMGEISTGFERWDNPDRISRHKKTPPEDFWTGYLKPTQLSDIFSGNWMDECLLGYFWWSGVPGNNLTTALQCISRPSANSFWRCQNFSDRFGNDTSDMMSQDRKWYIKISPD